MVGHMILGDGLPAPTSSTCCRFKYFVTSPPACPFHVHKGLEHLWVPRGPGTIPPPVPRDDRTHSRHLKETRAASKPPIATAERSSKPTPCRQAAAVQGLTLQHFRPPSRPPAGTLARAIPQNKMKEFFKAGASHPAGRAHSRKLGRCW